MNPNPFKFDNIDKDAKIVFLEDGSPSIFYHKIWQIEVDPGSNFSESLIAHGIDFVKYSNRSKDKLVYHFYSEEDRDNAKFLI